MMTTPVTGTEVFPRLQNHTMQSCRFRRPEAAVLSVTPAAADDTGLGSDFMLDQVDGSWPTVASIQLLGTTFHVELDDELGVVVSHPKWSLMGYGPTLVAAERMLMDYARELAETMVGDSPVEYTAEGNRLRVFALRFLYLTPGE